MRVLGDDGRLLDAEYFIDAGDAGLALVLESAGGAGTSRPARNTQYRQALTVLLSGLRDLDGVITDALVDSRHTRRLGLAAAERRLISSPVLLAREPDMEALRLLLTSGQARIGQRPDVAKGGNNSKRIRLELDVPGFTVTDGARLADVLRNPAQGQAPGSEPGPAEASQDSQPEVAVLAASLEAVRSLSVQRGPGDLAKRHQPLTLLSAIGRARRGADRMVPWPRARAEIGQLILQHGHSTDARNPHLPFLALASSPLWELTADPPPKGRAGDACLAWLNQADPAVGGGLVRAVYSLVAESGDAARHLADTLISEYFQEVDPADLLAVAGFSHRPGTSSEPPASQGLPRSHGRMTDAIVRAAIEKHAVDMAMNSYRQKGYDVTDVGARESYDIHATAAGQERHIEVKGTTMDATHIELTTAEVRHARTEPTDLVVVDQIKWHRKPDGTIATSGGRYRSWTDWQPAQTHLKPSRYQYQLPS